MLFRCLRNAILEEKRGHSSGSEPFGGLGIFVDSKKVKSATGSDDDGRAVRCSWIRSKDRDLDFSMLRTNETEFSRIKAKMIGANGRKLKIKVSDG